MVTIAGSDRSDISNHTHFSGSEQQENVSYYSGKGGPKKVIQNYALEAVRRLYSQAFGEEGGQLLAELQGQGNGIQYKDVESGETVNVSGPQRAKSMGKTLNKVIGITLAHGGIQDKLKAQKLLEFVRRANVA